MLVNAVNVWFYAIPFLAHVLCTIAVFLYAATRRSDGTKARMFAMIGFGLIVVNTLGHSFISYFLSRSVDVATFGQITLVIDVLRNLLSIISMVFLAAAVFTGREVRQPAGPMAQQRPESLAEDNSNPYHPPER